MEREEGRWREMRGGGERGGEAEREEGRWREEETINWSGLIVLSSCVSATHDSSAPLCSIGRDREEVSKGVRDREKGEEGEEGEVEKGAPMKSVWLNVCVCVCVCDISLPIYNGCDVIYRLCRCPRGEEGERRRRRRER